MQPAAANPAPTPTPAPSALCPAHGQVASGTCLRCGGFYCEACPAVGGTCPACLNRTGDQPMYFATSPVRLAVLHMVTFSMFHLVWLYRNWKFEKARTGEDISPFWRTFFSGIFVHSLFTRMNRQAEQAGIPGISPGGRTVAYWGMYLMQMVPVVGPLFVLLAFVPLLGAQKLANELNARFTPAAPARTPLTGGNIFFMVLPAIFTALAIVMGVLAAIAEAATQQ